MKRTHPKKKQQLQKTFLQQRQIPTQECPKCGYTIGAIAGLVDAICQNCGYKYPCCET